MDDDNFRKRAVKTRGKRRFTSSWENNGRSYFLVQGVQKIYFLITVGIFVVVARRDKNI